MYHKVVVSLFWIASLFFTFHPAVYAAKEVAEPVLVSSLPAHANLTGKEHEFDVHEANAILHQLSQQISNPDLNATKLRSAISLLLTTQKKATECINDAEKEIAKLDKTQKADQTDQLAVNAEAEEKAYITGKKNVLLERKAACRLFYLRSQDLLSNYDGALNQLTKFELMEGGPKRWAAFNLAEVFSSDLLEAFNNEFLQNSLSTKNFHPSFAMILSILLLISAWIGRRITQF